MKYNFILLFQLRDPRWKPDFGPAEFVPSWGATAVGARKFLIAYNINVLATKEQAHRMALDIRETGRGEGQVKVRDIVYENFFFAFYTQLV